MLILNLTKWLITMNTLSLVLTLTKICDDVNLGDLESVVSSPGKIIWTMNKLLI